MTIVCMLKPSHNERKRERVGEKTHRNYSDSIGALLQIRHKKQNRWHESERDGVGGEYEIKSRLLVIEINYINCILFSWFYASYNRRLLCLSDCKSIDRLTKSIQTKLRTLLHRSLERASVRACLAL